MDNSVALKPFKRGDTPVFRFYFKNPYAGFDWSSVLMDCAMTDVQAPIDNSGADAVRQNQALSTDANGAFYQFMLTVAESKALTAGMTYRVEAQLKQGMTNVVTPVTATVKVLQDYVI